MINRVPAVRDGIRTYTVAEAHNLGGRGNELPAGYLLRQCYDDWYQVFTPAGEKCCYRIGPELFAKIKFTTEDGEELHNTHSESKPVDVPPGQLFA